MASSFGPPLFWTVPMSPFFDVSISHFVFIVECVGDDLGEDTTDRADQLRGHLAAAGVLAGGVFEPVPLQPGQA